MTHEEALNKIGFLHTHVTSLLKENEELRGYVEILKHHAQNSHKHVIAQLTNELEKLKANGRLVDKFEVSRYKDINKQLKRRIAELESQLVHD